LIRYPFQTKSDGFTIVEIIIVIAVISTLAGSMAPMISQRIEAAREDSTQIKMETLRKALLAYARDTGSFPKEKTKGTDSLVALEEDGVGTPSGWRGPYIIGTYESRDYTHDA
jgi:general secretion pathway protein G